MGSVLRVRGKVPCLWLKVQARPWVCSSHAWKGCCRQMLMKPWPPRDHLEQEGAPIFQGLLGGQGARAGKGHGRTWAPPAFLREIGKCVCVPGHGLCGQWGRWGPDIGDTQAGSVRRTVALGGRYDVQKPVVHRLRQSPFPSRPECPNVVSAPPSISIWPGSAHQANILGTCPFSLSPSHIYIILGSSSP